MRPRPSWALAPLGAAIALVLLLGTVTLGIRLRSAGGSDDLPDAAPLDYAAALGAFSPLSPSFIRDVLGGIVGLPGRTAATSDASRGRDEPAVQATPFKRVEVVHRLTNDNRSQARPIPSVPFTARTDTRRATRESGEADACGPIGGGTVWYRYKAVADVGLIANTFGSSYATSIGVFADDKGLTNIGCDTDVQGNAIVQFAVRKGATYFFQIAGPAGGGDLVFSLDPEGVTTIASVSRSGEPANAAANSPSVSADGRFVAFESTATNLVPGHTYDTSQIYVHDHVTSTVELASADDDGDAGNGNSESAFVSGDGRFVAFESLATNLVAGDTNDSRDVFVRDVVTGTTERVSVSSEGKQALKESPTEWGEATPDRVLYDEDQPGADFTMYPTMTPDGRYVTFQSKAANLVAGDDNHMIDVFVHDRVTRLTERVSVSSSGGERGPDTYYIRNSNEDSMTPSISANGRVVMFRTSAANLVRGDTNESHDIFVHDRRTHITQRITDSSEQFNLTDDDQPRYAMNEIRPRSALSFDGRYVAFTASPRPSYGPAEANIFVHDRRTGRDVLANVSSTGAKQEENRSTRGPTISSDGRYVAFHSNAGLVPGEPGLIFNVFVRDLATRTTVRLTSAPGQTTQPGPICQAPIPGCGSLSPSMSADGSVVAFEASVAGVTGADAQIYVNERPLAAG